MSGLKYKVRGQYLEVYASQKVLGDINRLAEKHGVLGYSYITNRKRETIGRRYYCLQEKRYRMNEVFPKKFMQALNRMYSMSRLAKKIAYQKMHLSSYVTSERPQPEYQEDSELLEEIRKQNSELQREIKVDSKKSLLEILKTVRRNPVDLSSVKAGPKWRQLESKSKSSAGIFEYMVQEDISINVFKVNPKRYIGLFNIISGHLGTISKHIGFLELTTSENRVTKFLVNNFPDLMKERLINRLDYLLSGFKKVQRSFEKKSRFLYLMHVLNVASKELKKNKEFFRSETKSLLNEKKIIDKKKKELAKYQKENPKAEERLIELQKKSIMRRFEKNNQARVESEEEYKNTKDALIAELKYKIFSFIGKGADAPLHIKVQGETIFLSRDIENYKVKKYLKMDVSKYFTKENLGVTLSRAVSQKCDLLIESHQN